MKTITLQTILDRLDDDAKEQRSSAFVLLIVFVLICIGCTVLINDTFLSYVLLAFLLLYILMVILLIKHQKKVKQRTFYIVSDTCQRKRIWRAGEDGNTYTLTFSDQLEHTINHGDVFLSTTKTSQDDEWLYLQTSGGDQFYMVYMDGDKQPTYIFPHKFCRLDTTGFILKDGKLRPNVS